MKSNLWVLTRVKVCVGGGSVVPQVSPFMVAPPSFAVAFRIHGYCCMYFYSVATPPLQVHFGLAAFVACAFMVAPPPLCDCVLNLRLLLHALSWLRHPPFASAFWTCGFCCVRFHGGATPPLARAFRKEYVGVGHQSSSMLGGEAVMPQLSPFVVAPPPARVCLQSVGVRVVCTTCKNAASG